MLGAIEAGGTKFVCAVGDEKGMIVERIQIPTIGPNETLQEVSTFFQKFKVDAIGIGSFGPIDVNKKALPMGILLLHPKQLGEISRSQKR